MYTLYGQDNNSDEFITVECSSLKTAYDLGRKKQEQDERFTPCWIEDPSGEIVIDFLH